MEGLLVCLLLILLLVLEHGLAQRQLQRWQAITSERNQSIRSLLHAP